MKTEVISITRLRWTLQGQLQGIGFRPFVYRLATEMHLSGWVRNASSCVLIEVQGDAAALDSFAARLLAELPTLARLTHNECVTVPVQPSAGFTIEPSAPDPAHRPVIPADLAVCSACVRELHDRHDFRHHYPLINCTQCGPRFSIIRAMPYDRARTTMRAFRLCEKCHQQYQSPVDRRFHAQPVACPACGPRVGLYDVITSEMQWADPLVEAARRIADGQIIAIKGIGGFHLACRADDAEVVRELRRRKRRDAKAFAIMCADLRTVQRLVHLSEQGLAELSSPAAPIVLAPSRMPPDQLDAIAPGNHRLGVMLPYTPIHHLLFAALAERGDITSLVMTSANLSDEPLVKDNPEAQERLAGIADAIVLHGREIERSIDDSVVLDMGDGEAPLPIRRARGYVPQVIRLAGRSARQGLCVGGEMKNAVALVREDEVIVSHHLGDLKHTLAYDGFRRAIDDLCHLLEVEPAWIAHDMHPAYLSTQWAKELATRWGVPTIAVQHHHAHAAALFAEHGIETRALALVCDGVGYGADGSAWGGELLELEGAAYRRVGHLRPILLAGGDAAARDTRRCAAAVLDAVGEPIDAMLVDETERALVELSLRTGRNAVSSSSAGRLFDAAAALLGVCNRNCHEAQAAMCMESLASRATVRKPHERQRWSIAQRDGVWQLDLLPMVANLAGCKDAAEAAWQFHHAFCAGWSEMAIAAAAQCGTEIVGLSGGVFCNELVTRMISERLLAAGLRVLRHEVVPPNDGGIALGQALIARRLNN